MRESAHLLCHHTIKTSSPMARFCMEMRRKPRSDCDMFSLGTENRTVYFDFNNVSIEKVLV